MMTEEDIEKNEVEEICLGIKVCHNWCLLFKLFHFLFLNFKI